MMHRWLGVTQICAACALVWTGCGDSGDDGADMSSGATTSGDTSGAGADAGVTSGGDAGMTSAGDTSDAGTTGGDDGGTTEVEPLGRCEYINPFSQGDECKQYTGAGWTEAAAAEDCADVLPGVSGALVMGERCGYDALLGTCRGGDPATDAYEILSEGSDDSLCGPAEVGCNLLGGGEFEPGNTCEGGGSTGDPTQGGVFTPPFQECVEPLAGEPAGDGPDGTVCTQQAISGATEPGRRFADYGRCDVVLTQRPYYPVPPEKPAAGEGDPRLEDEAYMGELAWVTSQIESTACVCCHSEQTAPNGPSNWYIDAGALWIDTMADSGVAMMAGLADSTSFGAFPPEENNGFDRETTGQPTTDIERMRAFFVNELARRGAPTDPADYEPFGGPLYDQLVFEPPRCDSQGVTDEGGVYWTGGEARYVYVLEVGAANPGVPPNLDLPEGTLWRLDVLPEGAPIARGFAYGEVPEGAVQRWPGEGKPAELEPGTDYYLYVMRDIGLPVTRCVFTYGE